MLGLLGRFLGDWIPRFQVSPSVFVYNYVLCSRSGIKNTSLVQSSERSSIERTIRILSQWAIQKTTLVRVFNHSNSETGGKPLVLGRFMVVASGSLLDSSDFMTFQCFNMSMGQSKTGIERGESHQAETL